MTASGVPVWLRDRPLLSDSVLAGVLLMASLCSMAVGPDYTAARELDALGTVLVVLGCLPLALRRAAPLPALAVVSVATSVATSLDFATGVLSVSVLVGVYTVAAYGRRGEARLALLLGAATFLATIPFVDGEVRATDLVAVVGVVLAAYAFGRSIGFRRAYTAELELRAARMERARESDLRAVVAEERGRIARELHDVVAHAVSVMTVQASAAQRTIERNPAASREAMRAVEQTGRQALTDMRRIVGVLRSAGEQQGELAPQPGVADLPALLDHVREAGLPVRLHVLGRPRELPSGIDLTIYRLVQESVTNALKHAGPTTADVTLTYAPQAVGVLVRDRGRGAASRLGQFGGGELRGHGLLGMRERVTLYGGSLRAGPAAGGGYEVDARIPVEGWADADDQQQANSATTTGTTASAAAPSATTPAGAPLPAGTVQAEAVHGRRSVGS
jgi:signal transduction histidine kinase